MLDNLALELFHLGDTIGVGNMLIIALVFTGMGLCAIVCVPVALF